MSELDRWKTGKVVALEGGLGIKSCNECLRSVSQAVTRLERSTNGFITFYVVTNQ